MVEGHEINNIIRETIEELSSNEKLITDFLNKSLKYELDIWNRNVPNVNIEEKYDEILNEVMRK